MVPTPETYHIGFIHLAAGLAAGLAVIGGGLGIGRVVAAALEASGRQPEAQGDLRTTMIIGAALIEGVTLFAEVIAIIMALRP